MIKTYVKNIFQNVVFFHLDYSLYMYIIYIIYIINIVGNERPTAVRTCRAYCCTRAALILENQFTSNTTGRKYFYIDIKTDEIHCRYSICRWKNYTIESKNQHSHKKWNFCWSLMFLKIQNFQSKSLKS